MKLNLLPTYVSKGAQAKTFALLTMVLLALSIIGCVLMIVISNKNLNNAKDNVARIKPEADQAVAIAKQADTILANSANLTRNVQLATDMMEHNPKFPRFYRQILPYIPNYMRLTALSATPVDENSCVLTVQGVIQTYQQYADLMLAMLRIPGATTAARSGFVVNDYQVPSVIETDQRALPFKTGDARLPLDPIERLNAMIAKATGETTGFSGAGGFGTGPETPRGPMPGWSEVTVNVTLTRDPTWGPGQGINFDLRTPNPRATLSAQVAGGTVPANTPAPTTPAPNTPPITPGGGPPRQDRDDI